MEWNIKGYFPGTYRSCYISAISFYIVSFLLYLQKLKEELGRSNESFGPTAINKRIVIKYGTGPYTKHYGAN